MSARYLSRFRLTAGLLLCVAPFVVLVPAFGQVPEDETTKFAGFDAGMTCGAIPATDCVTVGMWNQTLLPANVNFQGRTITEQNGNPGGGGSGMDTCYFTGSAFAVGDKIPPGPPWTVGANNVYGPDYVGWLLSAVNYYRNKGRAPCGTRFQQRMVISIAGGMTRVYGGPNTGNTNTVGGDINVRSVTSVRAGQTKPLNR